MSSETTRRVLLIVLSLCSTIVHAQDEDDTLVRARARNALDVAVYDNFSPFSYRDAQRQPAGLDVELARALAGALGLPLRIRMIAADESVSDDLRNNVWKGHYLGGGVADVMMHVPTDAEFVAEESQSVLFGTYLHETIAIAHRPGAVKSLASPVAMASYRIAVENDSISDYYLSGAFGGRLRTAAIRKSTLSDALDAVLSGEVDAVMGPKAQLQGLLALQSDRNVEFRDQQLAGLLRGSWNVGIAIRKEGGSALHESLETALQTLRSNGTVGRLLAAYRIDASLQARDLAASALEEVTVSASPLPGFDVAIDRVPSNVQRSDSVATRGAGLTQQLQREFGSVFINEAQSNPLQPDVQYRGFVASPLLGQPQGIAVYQDGVRINDAFGDTVNWALVPEGAIERIELMPGSNPVFGLNTLGGALSLRTKTGFDVEDTTFDARAGSRGQRIGGLQTGGTSGGFGYFGSARHFEEDGWRRESPSSALHLFGSVGWRGTESSLDLTATRITTDLVGNGPAPVQLLEEDRAAVYTHPDRTQNALTFVTLSGAHTLSSALHVSGVVFVRNGTTRTLNGDEANFDESLGDAALNRSSTRQSAHGATIQLGSEVATGPLSHRIVLGAAGDRSSIDFGSSTEAGQLDESRGAIGNGVVLDDSLVDLGTTVSNASVYFTDTVALRPRWDLTLGARYNRSRLQLDDRIDTDLDGDHEFRRFNRALGLTYRPGAAVAVYANYSESNRAPSPVELTCADEDAPCALPNSFLSDPPLEQVVARTVELGVRGEWASVRWHLGGFSATNANDILFISAGALTNRGYFDNVGDTRRAGIELDLSGVAFERRLQWFAHYTRLNARFLDSFSVASPHNPFALDGEIVVERGAQLPGVPKQLLKAGAGWRFFKSLTIGVDALYQSSQYFRGDEGNAAAPLPGFVVLNASAQWLVTDALTVSLEVDNMLNRRYATFGLYGAADEVLGDEFDDPRFVSPAAPRGVWLGINLRL